jgi:predicted ester cyclase
MSNIEKAKALYTALGRGDSATASTYMTDDFVVSGPTPQPLGKQEYLGLHEIMARAFPDWNFNISDVVEEGDKITLTIAISGTHNGVFDLSPMGLPIPAIEPTGKKVQLPQEKPVLTVRNGKFSALYLPVVQGGGVPGFLSQLGVEAPTAH